MEILKFIAVWFIYISTCSTMENQTMNLDKQLLSIQKREKQYLLEDDAYNGPQQKRDERQSFQGKTTATEPQLLHNSPVRLQPKTYQSQLKPVLKPLPKPNNIAIEATSRRVPKKNPVVLKNAKVVPGPAHALRLQMMENRKNESVPNSKIYLNTTEDDKVTIIKEVQLPPIKEESIPYSTEDKVNLITEGHVSTNKENEVIPKQETVVTLNNDSHSNLIKDEDKGIITVSEDASLTRINKGAQNKDSQVTLDINRKKNINEKAKMVTKPLVNLKEENSQPKPILFIEEEADPLAPVNKKERTENKIAKKMENSPYKIKEIPITKKFTNKPNIDEITRRHDQTENDPDFVQISNGTHILSIKKISNHDRHKMQHILARDEFDDPQPPVEEKILNKSPTESSSADKVEENVMLAGILLSGNEKKENTNINYNTELNCADANEKDSDDCITIINHDYKECEEITTIPSAVPNSICDDLNQESWNQNVYDSYKINYNVNENDKNIPSLLIMSDSNHNEENNGEHTQNPEYTQVYNGNENQPNFNDLDNFRNKPEIVPFFPCLPALRNENILNRIWRTWKDVEITVRKPQNRNKPNIDVKRNMVDNLFSISGDFTNGDIVTTTPIAYATPPKGLNGYYNNQNSASIYPYVNPTYRNVR